MHLVVQFRIASTSINFIDRWIFIFLWQCIVLYLKHKLIIHDKIRAVRIYASIQHYMDRSSNSSAQFKLLPSTSSSTQLRSLFPGFSGGFEKMSIVNAGCILNKA